MTLYEVGIEYEQSADKLRKRLSELRAALKDAQQYNERWAIRRRIAELTPMLTDCNKLAAYCKKYYDKGYPLCDGPFDRGPKPRTGNGKTANFVGTACGIEKRTNPRSKGSSNGMSNDGANVYGSSGRTRRKQIDYLSNVLPRISESEKNT